MNPYLERALSWKDTALDLVLGKSDWERAAQGYEDNSWSELLSGAAMGALAVASVAPVGGVGKAARAGLKGAAREGLEGAGRGVDADLLAPGKGNLGVDLGPASQPAPGPPDPAVDALLSGWLDEGVETPLGRFPNALESGPAGPGIRDAVPKDQVRAQRARIVEQRAKAMSENPILEPAYEEALADELMSSSDLLEETMSSFAPFGVPRRQAKLRGNWYRDKKGDLVPMVEDGVPLGPLAADLGEGGMGLSPSPWREPETALADLAATWQSAKGSARGRAKREFAREWVRTNQNQLGGLDSSMYDGPRFYIDRAEQIRGASSAAEGAFGPEVVAAASAASSASAPPILEPVRLMIGLPFVRWQNGKAVFGPAEKKAFKEAFPGFANGNFVASGIEAFVKTVNNPDFLTAGSVKGLAHKTHPYALLGLDPENPHAFVADRNFWYLANGHKLKKDSKLIRGRGSREPRLPDQVTDPMGRGVLGSVPTVSASRAAQRALGVATPGTMQETQWFGPRVMTQMNIEDSFRMAEGPGSSRTTLVNALGADVAAKLASPDGSVDWSALMGEALERAGSHWGKANRDALRVGASANRSRFLEAVASGRRSAWEMVDGQPRPRRDDWRNVLPSDERYSGPTDKLLTGKVAEGSVEGVDDLLGDEVLASQVKPNVSVPKADRVLNEVVPAMAEWLRSLTSDQQGRALSVAGAVLAAGGSVAAAVEAAGQAVGPAEPDDDEMIGYAGATA